MPFTPLHMGPAIILKIVMRRRLSLMVFGWSQILMDLQPLYVMVTGQGELHGLSHTCIGAGAIGLAAGVSGKFAGELGLRLLRQDSHLPISWKVAMASAFVGTFSHIAIDSIMHVDVMSLFPFSTKSPWHGLLTFDQLSLACLVAGILGAALYWWTEQPLRRADKE